MIFSKLNGPICRCSTGTRVERQYIWKLAWQRTPSFIVRSFAQFSDLNAKKGYRRKTDLKRKSESPKTPTVYSCDGKRRRGGSTPTRSTPKNLTSGYRQCRSRRKSRDI